jgi:hypothetical protein
MDQVAESIRERDVRIVALEQLVTDLSRDHAPMPLLASPYEGARHRRAPVDTAQAETAQAGTVQAETVQPPRDVQATEPARLPFERQRPSGDFGPPERSHD